VKLCSGMASTTSAPAAPSALTAGRLYALNTHYPDRSWFGLVDMWMRYHTAAGMYYYYVVTHPVTFLKYMWDWHSTWSGRGTAVVAVATYLTFPMTVVGWAMWKRIKPMIFRADKDDWMMAGPGRVFFLSPKGRLATMYWDAYLELSQLVGVFTMCKKTGGISLAVEHSLYDRLTDKNFWRKVMEDTEMRIPQELGRVKDNKVSINPGALIEGADIVAKVADSYLGIGDKFMKFGEDYKSLAELKDSSEKEEMWKGKEVLLLEWMRPLPSLGVHSLDIVTIMTSSGPKVVSVLFWGECTGSSSHSAKGGYIVDVESETITSTAKFYSPYFAEQKGALVGLKLPGVKGAVEMALRAHAEAQKKQKWLMMIGWDCMFTRKEGEVVFFEGNFAASRIHRRITFGPGNALAFLASYSWPFTMFG